MVIALLNTSYIHTHRYLTNPNQCCATTPSFGFFDRLDCPYRICTVQDGASTVCLKSTVQTVQGRCHLIVQF
jgi:hypothetical protein